MACECVHKFSNAERRESEEEEGRDSFIISGFQLKKNKKNGGVSNPF